MLVRCVVFWGEDSNLLHCQHCVPLAACTCTQGHTLTGTCVHDCAHMHTILSTRGVDTHARAHAHTTRVHTSPQMVFYGSGRYFSVFSDLDAVSLGNYGKSCLFRGGGGKSYLFRGG